MRSGVLSSHWVQISRAVPPAELYSRLMKNWTISASLSGLLSGFTFFVLSQAPPQQTTTYLASVNVRDASTGALVVCFVLSVQSAILSAIFMHFINKLGRDDGEALHLFVRTFSGIVDLPNQLIITALLTLSVTIITLVACLYPLSIFVLVVVLATSASAFTLVTDIRMRVFLKNALDKERAGAANETAAVKVEA